MRSGPRAASLIALTRRIPAKATDSSTPDISPETWAGAWLCASGSQLCIGASPALVARPSAASANPIRAVSVRPGCPTRSAQDRVAEVPVAAYSRTIPRKAMATPTEPSTTYFQAASRPCRPPRKATRKAVVIVVASMATQSTPRLSASTARLIAARNRHISAENRPFGLLVVAPQVATTATAPTTMSRYAVSASTRSRPPAPRWPAGPRASMTTAQASTAAAAAAGVCRTTRARSAASEPRASTVGTTRAAQMTSAQLTAAEPAVASVISPSAH